MYTEEQEKRLDELYLAIEANKEHEYSAPTYKDSPALQEMVSIILGVDAKSESGLQEKIAVLWYISTCYDEMCRWGVSVKYHKMLLESHVKLMKISKYTADERSRFEGAFYSAVKARNQFVPDNCADLVELVTGFMPEKKMREFLQNAKDSRLGLPKNDPVEMTEEYLAVIDEVEALIEENSTLHFCHEYWSLKSDFLAERGIMWRSPVELNPGVMFD